jgi:hypothetical protein
MLLDTTAAEANKIVCSMMWSSSRKKKEVQRENSRYIIKTHMTKYGTILFQSSYHIVVPEESKLELSDHQLL